MRVLMVAPPGAGKGTQGAVIATHFDIPHIATGDLLRDNVARRTELGRAVRDHLDRGELVPDEIVLDMVARRVRARRKQAAAGTCSTACHATWRRPGHCTRSARPGHDRERGAAPEGRRRGADPPAAGPGGAGHASDDTEPVIRRRLALYHEVTHPIVDWYASRGILVSVDAMRPVERVARQILTALEAMRSAGRARARTRAPADRPDRSGRGIRCRRLSPPR